MSMLNRRGFAASGLSLGAGLWAGRAAHGGPQAGGPAAPAIDRTVSFCLNTSTIQGQQLSVPEQIDLAGKVGYDGLEPWLPDLEKCIAGGVSAKELRKRLDDRGVRVESAIGFANWIVDDPKQRAEGLEQARRDMGLIAELGGARIAAPPAGATEQLVPLDAAAERYAKLLEVGRATGVRPMLELWGFSTTLSRLSELLYVATASGDADASLLLDVYHVHRGGTPTAALGMAPGTKVPVLHMNDYPAEPPGPKLNDSDRVMPGDGVAPITEILRTLHASGFAGVLSIELFNRDYWKQPAEQVAARALDSMRHAWQDAIQYATR
jgi:2-keto-myo-inositol isomerase